jgi:hypothetical protein
LSQFIPAQIFLFSCALFRGEFCAKFRDVRATKFRVVRQQPRQRLVNLRVTFGKTLAQFTGNTLNLKIAARQVANSIAEAPQLASEFVVIGVLGKLSRPQQFEILQCLPTVLHLVKSGVEDDAMRVQMRIERSRRVVREQGGGEVARETVVLHPTNPNASRRERLEFRERHSHGSCMGFENPFVLAQESHNGNRLRR